jgi:hypothetical protein
MREYIASVPSSLTRLVQEVDENVAICEMVESFGYRLPDKIRDSRWKMFASPGTVGKACAAKNEELSREND